MSTGETVYRLLLYGVRAVAPLLARGDSKLARGIRGRRDAAGALAAWGRRTRDPARPTAWFHAPSLGEGLLARVVMETLAASRPATQLVFTHFSPSAEALADRMPAEVAGYLPWDLPDEVGPVLDALSPALLAFTRSEVWPVLSREAARRGIPTVLIGAALPPDAGRLRWPARAVLRPAFGRLDRLCAISEEDGERFRLLGVPPERVEVTGDPGVDSAARRVDGADSDAPFLRPFHERPRPTLVAGSTWPPDERVLVPAASRARERHPELRLVVAPHEPHDGHVRPLLAGLRTEGWRVRRLSEVEEAGSAEGADAVIVDRVGVLAPLYTVGHLAWVGGGFHGDGLHSVLEPAAAGLPVIFGPAHGNARAAGDLLAAGAAVEVDSTETAREAMERWLGDDGARRESGRRARAYVDAHRGAAERTARILEELLGAGG